MPKRFELEDNKDSQIEGGGEGFFDSKNSSLGKQEKRIFVFMLVVTILVVFFGFWQLRRNINLPAEKQLALWHEMSAAGKYDFGASESSEALKNKDTDNDGLSDYDELYIYRTSPYLEDSDSDGVMDREEIEKGRDPNCDENKSDCYLETTVDTDSGNANIPTTDDLSVGNLISGQTTPQMTAEQLRQLLVQSGLSAEVVAKFTDEQLMSMYQQMVSGESLSLPTGGEDNTNSASATPSAADLRKWLIDSGIPEADVKKFSDAQLLEIYQKSTSADGTNTNTNQPKKEPTAEEKQMAEAVSKMTGAQVRELLAKNGFDQAILEKYNDDQLKDLLLKSLTGQ
jgi:preprotein translocase subunit SecF